jgi:hypothetical protein
MNQELQGQDGGLDMPAGMLIVILLLMIRELCILHSTVSVHLMGQAHSMATELSAAYGRQCGLYWTVDPV